MNRADPAIDYDGAIVVVQIAPGRIVLTHPTGDLGEASLPGNPCGSGEEPAAFAVRMVREMTGLEVEIDDEIDTFVQAGTPTGTMLAHGYLAHPVGGTLLEEGPEGPVREYTVDDMPPIIGVRVAIQRVLRTWLDQHSSTTPRGG